MRAFFGPLSAVSFLTNKREIPFRWLIVSRLCHHNCVIIRRRINFSFLYFLRQIRLRRGRGLWQWKVVRPRFYCAVALRCRRRVRRLCFDALCWFDPTNLRLSTGGWHQSVYLRLLVFVFRWSDETRHFVCGPIVGWRDDGVEISEVPGVFLLRRHVLSRRQCANCRPFGAHRLSAPRPFVTRQQ